MLSYDPNVGFLLNGQRANLHGRVGRNVLDANTAAEGALSSNAYDPRYYEAYTYNNGDAGEQTAYRLRPEYQQRLGNRTQLASHSVGGYGEVIDPNQVEYDEEFGLITDRRNIKDPATPRDNLMGNLAMAAVALPIGYGIALDSGLLGAASGGGGTNLGTYSGMTTGLDGVTGTLAGEAAGAGMATIPESLLQNITIPPLDIADPSLLSLPDVGGGYLSNLMAAVRNNPGLLARGLLGGASLINGLSNNNNSSGPGAGNGDGSGDLTPANVPRFNPAGLLANYRAPTFDPVPFMSGNYSLLGG